MNNKTIRHVVTIIMCLFAGLQMSCASAISGKAVSLADSVPVQERIKGQDKASIIRTLGDPDFITKGEENEYWGYRNSNQWNMNLYYLSGGKVDARDLVVELYEGKAKDSYFVDKGKSIGVIASPLSVPE